MTHASFTVSSPPPVKEPDLRAVVSWAERTFEQYQRTMLDHTEEELRTRHVAPDRPREGMIVHADGTNWNPGKGAGAYVYTGGAWVFLSGNTAAQIAFTPAGDIAAITVQLAIEELDSEKIAKALLTTRGDLIRRSATAPERVALGATDSVLSSDGTDAVWATLIALLSGLAITAATVAAGDKILIQDVDDSDNLKTVTAQAIADLAVTDAAFLAIGTTGNDGSPVLDPVPFATTEAFDIGADYATNVFTAPTTGRYQLSVGMTVANPASPPTTVTVSLVTSNRTYAMVVELEAAASADEISMSVLADMDAADTAKVTLLADNDVDYNARYFSGYRVP